MNININEQQTIFNNVENFFSQFLNEDETFLNWFSDLGTKFIVDQKAEMVFIDHRKKYNELSDSLLAKTIDHTLLKPDAVLSEIQILCKEAIEFNFASVCVNPCYVEYCAKELIGSNVKTCSVIGFPLGSNLSSIKTIEAESAIDDGASEIDIVFNIGQLKQNNYIYVYEELSNIISKAKANSILTKIIIETCLLSNEDKIEACLISKSAGADYVKTSTGFSKSGANIQDVALMKFIVGEETSVKASGGIKTRNDAVNMLMYGADRIGTSSGKTIISNLN